MGRVLIFVALVLGAKPEELSRVKFVFGAGVETVRKADRVEAWRVAKGKHGALETPDGGGGFGGYVLKGDAVEVMPEAARKLEQALLDESAYPPPPECPSGQGCGTGKLCVFNPGVALRFHRGAKWADVLLCFDCEEIAVTDLGDGYFDPGRARLVRAVKAAFPADAEIQALEESPK